MSKENVSVNPMRFKFLKTGLLSLIVAVVASPWSAYGELFSPETGGPILTVVNNTEWDIQVGVGFNNGGTIDPVVVVAPRQKTSELEFISSDGKYKYQFGVAGTNSGTLVARAEEWPKDVSNKHLEDQGMILVKLKKGASGTTELSYRGLIMPFYELDYENFEPTTKEIDWVLKWNFEKNNGWVLTIKEMEVSI